LAAAGEKLIGQTLSRRFPVHNYTSLAVFDPWSGAIPIQQAAIDGGGAFRRRAQIAVEETSFWTKSRFEFFSSANARIRPRSSEDCAGEPPGELIASATAASRLGAKARSKTVA